jgi:hypothetical protein
MKKIKKLSAILVSILLLVNLSSKAQNNFVSFQISSNVSGSGLGGNVCPSVSFTNNHSTIGIGPNFQRSRMNYSGMQMFYRYSVAKNANERLELFFSGNLAFHTSAYLSKSNVDIEERCNPEIKSKAGEMQLKVVEYYTNIGLKINANKYFNVALSSGIGAYNTLDKNYDTNMYRQKNAVVLQIKLSLIYNIKI